MVTKKASDIVSYQQEIIETLLRGYAVKSGSIEHFQFAELIKNQRLSTWELAWVISIIESQCPFNNIPWEFLRKDAISTHNRLLKTIAGVVDYFREVDNCNKSPVFESSEVTHTRLGVSLELFEDWLGEKKGISVYLIDRVVNPLDSKIFLAIKKDFFDSALPTFLNLTQAAAFLKWDLNQLAECVGNKSSSMYICLPSKLNPFYGYFFKDETKKLEDKIIEYGNFYQGMAKSELLDAGFELEEISEEENQYLAVCGDDLFDVCFDSNDKVSTIRFPSIKRCYAQPYAQLLDESTLEVFSRDKVTITHVVGEDGKHDGCLNTPIDITKADLYIRKCDLFEMRAQFGGLFFSNSAHSGTGGFTAMLPHQIQGNVTKRLTQVVDLFRQVCVENPIRILLDKLPAEVELINLAWVLAICKKCDSFKDFNSEDKVLCAMAEALRKEIIGKIHCFPDLRAKYYDEPDVATHGTVDKTLSYTLTKEVLSYIAELSEYQEYFLAEKPTDRVGCVDGVTSIPTCRQDAISDAVLQIILPSIWPDTTINFDKTKRWKAFKMLESALEKVGANNIKLRALEKAKEKSEIFAVDKNEGEISTTFKAFKDRLKNLLAVYRAQSSRS